MSGSLGTKCACECDKIKYYNIYVVIYAAQIIIYNYNMINITNTDVLPPKHQALCQHASNNKAL